MGKALALVNSGYQMSAGNVAEVGGSGRPYRHPGRLKIHCILPSSPWLADSKTNIPLGVLYIAALLREQGHDVMVTSMLDKRYEGQITLPAAALTADVHMLGFCTPQFGEALEIAAYIRAHAPGALIVAGGPHPSYEPVEVAAAGVQETYHVAGPLPRRRDYRPVDGSRPLFDAVVAMEGERAVPMLLSDWKQGALQRIYYGDKADAPDLDAIPFPAWDLLPDDHLYNDGVAVMKHRYVESPTRPGTWPVMSIIGTRGCPYKCTYCSTPWIGQKPRYRSPANLIAEMQAVMDRGIRMFKFQDDTYTLHRTRLRELAEAVEGAFGPGAFASRIHTRVNTMDDHVAESLTRLNCKVTCFGIESGAQAVLDANQKGTRVEQNTAALMTAKCHGFYTIGFLVIGMAGETRETLQQTKDWLVSVRPYLDSCNVAVGIPYPGSRWWTHPAESAIEIADYNYDNQWIVGFSARDEVLVRPAGMTLDAMMAEKRAFFDFMVEHGWAKAEWDEDVRIRRQHDAALPPGAAGTLSYAGH